MTAASNEGMVGFMDFFLGKNNYDPVFFHPLAPTEYMSSFKYMGLKDLFLLTTTTTKAKLCLHKHYHHKQTNDRHKQIQI